MQVTSTVLVAMEILICCSCLSDQPVQQSYTVFNHTNPVSSSRLAFVFSLPQFLPVYHELVKQYES